jgi:transposase
MYNIQPQLRVQAVQCCLKNGMSLRKTATKFKVNYRSVFKWVKWYKEQGEARLLSTYTKSWRRTEKELEEKIVFLKEIDPALTVRKTKKIFEKQGIKISIKGIWGIWKRYGYAGFVKKSLSTDFRSYIPVFPETRQGIKIAEEFLKQDAISNAAKVLNDLSSCSKNELLKKIPDRFLTAHRKLEKYYSLWGEIPYPVLSKKLRGLRERFEEKGYIYSAMRAGILESLTLEWSGETKKQISLFVHLRKIYPRKRLDPALKFIYNLAAGSAHLRNLNIKEALYFLKECEKFINYLPKQSFLPSLLALYGNFGYYRKLKRLLNRHKKELSRDTFFFWQARLSATAGKYREYRIFLSKIKERREDPADILQNAQYLFFEKGKSQKAMDKVNLFFETAKTMVIRNYWDFISVFLAVLYSAQGKKNKGFLLIKRNLSLLRKLGTRKNVLFNEIIIDNPELPEYAGKINQFRLILLLKKASLTKKEKDYRKVLEFARREEILGTFHRFSVLFPEAIQNLLEKGGNTELPKAILKLPVFNKEVPVFHIKFLGELVVYKKQKYLKVKLPPKDSAFLIHLALRAGEPKKRTSLNIIYKNFWRSSKNPSRNLSHLLVRIKKVLKIPTHLLEVSYRKGNPVLINKGIYFTTDYSEFEQILAQAKALHRAGEWNLAKKEYIRAFSLFRGEPFRKMYDFWSEDLRTVILNKLENEVLSFVKELSSSGKKEEVKKLLKKTERIIPLSIKIRAVKL